MKLWIVTGHDEEGQLRDIQGVYSDLDKARDSVPGKWEYTGTHNGEPYGWYNGDYGIDTAQLDGDNA